MDECRSFPCSADGVAHGECSADNTDSGPDAYSCACYDGYLGENCATDIDECDLCASEESRCAIPPEMLVCSSDDEIPVTSPEGTACLGGECSTATCCFTPSCGDTDQQSTVFACGSDTILRASPETISCSGGACDATACCTQPTTDTCSSFNCETDETSPDDMLRTDAAGTDCVGPGCNAHTCCLTPTCAGVFLETAETSTAGCERFGEGWTVCGNGDCVPPNACPAAFDCAADLTTVSTIATGGGDTGTSFTLTAVNANIAADQVVTGTGIVGTVTVVSIDGTTLVLSSSQTLSVSTVLTMTASSDDVDVANKAAATCPHGECTSTQCCSIPSCSDIDQKGTAFDCSEDPTCSTDVLVADPVGTSCAGTSCDASRCCTVPTTDHCGSVPFSCVADGTSSHDVDLESPGDTLCVGAACTAETCCVVPTCADTDQAGTAYDCAPLAARVDQSAIECGGGGCNSDRCCVAPTCANVDQAGTVFPGNCGDSAQLLRSNAATVECCPNNDDGTVDSSCIVDGLKTCTATVCCGARSGEMCSSHTCGANTVLRLDAAAVECRSATACADATCCVTPTCADIIGTAATYGGVCASIAEEDECNSDADERCAESCTVTDYCAHESVCSDSADSHTVPAGSYFCSCATEGQPGGYGGKNCEDDFDECSSGPCGHYGNCTHFDRITETFPEWWDRSVSEDEGLVMDTSGDISHFYSCECEDGFTGENCGRNIDECATDPCQNDAGAQCLVRLLAHTNRSMLSFSPRALFRRMSRRHRGLHLQLSLRLARKELPR